MNGRLVVTAVSLDVEELSFVTLEVQQMAAMNKSGFDDQTIFGHNKSVDCDYYYNYSDCLLYTSDAADE